ncbi:hypothetical protein MSAN_00120700 [Mycena sanguinolenta]|uniref:Protein kinase domain-containing protein n=1 Tax=Mycena sanguinolenta TaxID=230812 RepID=A0A8H6ZHL2_9AGAR|nr:hypothetical protein MSAN_00120700 [Mycena sanguinolenta]
MLASLVAALLNAARKLSPRRLTPFPLPPPSMNDPSQLEPEFTHSSASDPESPFAVSRHASGMFSHSRNFTVTGKSLNNITNNYAALSLPSDFRMIPMGDIDLQHEIRVDNSTGVLNYHRQRAHVRRLYSAKVEGRKSTLTVAMYQGHGAEEKWRQDIAKYMSMRHPSIVQICGAASSNGIHATLFNDGTAISHRLRKFWIVIEIPLFGLYISMHSVIEISRKSTITSILNSSYKGTRSSVRIGYGTRLVGFAQSLLNQVVKDGVTLWSLYLITFHEYA